jgi:hypothetical protein
MHWRRRCHLIRTSSEAGAVRAVVAEDSLHQRMPSSPYPIPDSASRYMQAMGFTSSCELLFSTMVTVMMHARMGERLRSPAKRALAAYTKCPRVFTDHARPEFNVSFV